MFCSGMTVPQIATVVKNMLESLCSPSGLHPNRALREAFERAFCLSLSDSAPLLAWDREIGYGMSDVEVNENMAPAIMRTSEYWIEDDESAQWIRDVHTKPPELVISEKPPNIPDSCWEALDQDSRTIVRCMYNGGNELAYRCACLAAQINRISPTLGS